MGREWEMVLVCKKKELFLIKNGKKKLYRVLGNLRDIQSFTSS